jgi:hypothetical protein
MAVRNASVNEATSCAPMPIPCNTNPNTVILNSLKQKNNVKNSYSQTYLRRCNNRPSENSHSIRSHLRRSVQERYRTDEAEPDHEYNTP